MTTRSGGHRPPPFIVDDPGSWAIVAQVQRAIGGQMGAHHRRHTPMPGLLMLPQRHVPIERAGLDPEVATPVGAGRLRIAAALGDPADRLSFSDDGRTIFGESSRARRTWTLPSLTPGPVVAERRDPLPPPPEATALAGDLGEAFIAVPGDRYGAAIVRDGRLPAFAMFHHAEDPTARRLVRWITGVAAAAWSPDGRVLALAGDWGLLVALAAE